MIIAHRGASTLAPENTLAAFRLAAESGAEGLEFDIRLSSDGVPVIVHDPALKRTAGISAPVSSLTAIELSRLDAGSWFNERYPDKARPEFASEGIPTLTATLEIAKVFSGPIYIELKCDSDDSISQLADSVGRVIAGSSILDRLIVKSFRLGVIGHIRARVPSVKTAALFAPRLARLLKDERYMTDMALEFGADQLSVHHALLSRKLIHRAERHGMKVAVWTIDEPRGFRRAERLRVHSVITNDPRRMIGLRDELTRQATGDLSQRQS